MKKILAVVIFLFVLVASDTFGDSICSNCRGSGSYSIDVFTHGNWLRDTIKCSYCNGTGRIADRSSSSSSRSINDFDYDKIIVEINETIRKDPKNYLAYYLRAFAYMQKGNFTKAREDINMALLLRPDLLEAKKIDEELKQKGY